ncbi:MAG: outer membrane lipoprotein carrier protein LolA [Paracoccaceae bacterium]
MRRRHFLGGLAAALAVAPVRAAAQSKRLDRFSAYLNGFRTAMGRFTQFNPNGSHSTGRYMIKKPGFVRFEYDPPLKSAVVSDGTWIGVIDGKSNEGAQRYPLSKSPLSEILKGRIDLARSPLVRGVVDDGKKTFVTLADPKDKRVGKLTLIFDNKPISLRQWIVEDKSGQRTGFRLDTMETGMQIARREFSIETMALKLQGVRREPGNK